MRKRLIALAAVAALGASGCAHAERLRPGRWQVVYRPQDSHRKDNTLLVDTATGRTWFFDISRTRWWEIPRNNVEDGE